MNKAWLGATQVAAVWLSSGQCLSRWHRRCAVNIISSRRSELLHWGTSVPSLMMGWPCIVVYMTLVELQLDAQNSYSFIYNTFIKILYMFRALPCSSSGGLRRNCIYAASGIVTLCRWLSCAPVKKEPLHRTVTCREWGYQRLHICTVTT